MPVSESSTGKQGHEPFGERLRARRKALGLTLQQVADAAGFSVGFISQIERGITAPSLTSLVSVCRVLKVDVGHFLTPQKSDTPVTRKSERALFALDGKSDGRILYERASASFAGNVLRSTIMHFPPGHRSSEAMVHEGEEIFYVVSGALTIEIDGESMMLQAGDTAHFPSTRVHVTWNHTTEPTVVFHTCTIDVFGDGDSAGTGDNGPLITRAAERAQNLSLKLKKTTGTKT